MISRSIRMFGRFRVTFRNDLSVGKAFNLPFGAIEVFHAEYDLLGNPSKGTFWRWTRIDKSEDLRKLIPPTVAPPVDHNAYIKQYDVVGKLNSLLLMDGLPAPAPTLAFWMCDPKRISGTNPSFKGTVLRFSKAVVFDQFNQAGHLERRLPCIPQYANTASGEQHSSRIQIGNGDQGFEFRVEIGLPIPAPFAANRHAKNGKGRAALGVGGLYASALHSADPSGMPMGILTGGSDETDYQVSDNKVRIGDFGFSGNGKAPAEGVEFVRYGIGRDSKPNMGGGLGISAASLLSKLGFPGGKDSNRRASNSVEFVSEDKTENNVISWTYSVVCRRRVQPLDLDLSDQIGGILQKSGSIDLEVGFQCSFSDDEIFLTKDAGELPDLQCSSVVRLHWNDKRKFGKNDFLGTRLRQEPRVLDGNLLLEFGGIIEAARLMDMTRLSLLGSRSQPQSFFPSLQGFPGSNGEISANFVASLGNMEARFRLGERSTDQGDSKHPVRLGFNETEEIDWSSDRIPAKPTLAGITLEPDAPTKDHAIFEIDVWRLSSFKSAPLQLRAYFNGINRVQPQSGDEHFHIQFVHDLRAMAQASDDAVIRYEIQNSKKQNNPHGNDPEHWGKFRARLGSLDFTEHKQSKGLLSDGPKIPNSLKIRRRGRSVLDRRQIAVGQSTLDVELSLTLALGEVRPVTVDIPHGDRGERRADLLIDENPSAVKRASEERFVLSIDERLRDDQDWHLVARLFERNAEASDQRKSFTVIGEYPFYLYRYSRLPLDFSGNEQEAQVAEWDSDDREWRYKNVSELYHFTFPPAVTGESMDKPQRLEIHDPVEADVTSPIVQLDPDPHGKETYLVDSRLSPPTDIWTKPEDIARNFFLPEHSGRALFSQNGVFGPGMELAGLRGELLYGMPFGINVPEPETAVAKPRIAELTALAGQMVMVEQGDDEIDTMSRWVALRETMLNRPQRLEAWTLDPRRADPFVPAKFDQGVNFSLRRTALLKPPVEMEVDEAIAPDSVAIAPPRLAEHGLAGGALWPLESRNYVNALRNNPQSGGGSVEKFALSPHGGSGDQSAEFLLGNVKIISETRNGFVQKQRIEILGRISTFWHRAKHVVVYERTTSPSAQFAPELHADTRTERPVLRKVDEFIEVLEPVRRYPDFDGIAKQTTGFLEEVRFNSRIIRVNSAWGEDVGDVGWQVPLWNRGEAKIRPKVYPFPDISFATLGEGSDERPLAIQECLDVDNIYFFADAEQAQITSDTDAWPSRDAIDFTSICTPDYLAEKVDAANLTKEEESKRRPTAPNLLPGMRRFTWRLAPATTATQVNAALGDKPIFSGLETITFMRSQPGEASTPAGGLDTALTTRLEEAHSDALRGVETTAPWSAGDESSRPNQPTLSDYVDHQSGFSNYVPEQSSTTYDHAQAKAEVETLRNKLVEIQDTKPQTVFEELDKHFGDGNLVSAAKGLIQKNKDFLTKLDQFDSETCTRIQDRLSGQVNSRKLLLIEQTKTVQRELISLINIVDELLPDEVSIRKSTIRKKIVDELTARSDALFDQARQDVGNVLENIEKARTIVEDWKDEAQSALKRARKRVDDWHTAYDRNKPWSRNRIDRAIEKLQTEIAEVEAQANATLEELRQRLSSDITGTAATLSTKIARIMAHVLAKEKTLKGQVGKVEGMLIRHMKPVTSHLGKINASGDGSYDAKVQEVINKLDDKIPSLSGTPKDLAEKARDSLAINWPKIQGTASSASSKFQAAQDNAKETLQIINGGIETAKTETVEALNKAKTELREIQDSALALADQAGEDIKKDLDALSSTLSSTVDQMGDALRDLVSDLAFPDILDGLAADTREWLAEGIEVVERLNAEGVGVIDQWLGLQKETFDDAANNVTKALKKAVKTQVIGPVTDLILDPVTDQDWSLHRTELRPILINRLDGLADEMLRVIESGALVLTDVHKQIDAFCNQLAGFKASIWNAAEDVAKEFEDQLKSQFGSFIEKADGFIAGATSTLDDLKRVLNSAEELDRTFIDLSNQVGEGAEYARAYLDRTIDYIGKLGSGGFKAGPNNILKLYSAVFQAPEIAALQANMDRIRGTFQHAENLIKTSKAKVLFEKLGDALKAMGLELPFKQLGDKFKLDEDILRGTKFSDVFGNFGGLDVSQLIPDFGNAGGFSEYIDVTHDFDKKAVRAWVKIDVSIPIKGRRKLFSIGPFTLFFRDSMLDGFVRIEASKDTDEVTSTDLAIIQTNIEAVVGGQVMVTLQDVQLVYTKDKGLDFVFDARNIKLNPTFKFIQETLGNLFGDELGGLKLIKQNGIPVGLEHEFKIPPVSLMFGTSGVSNIQISNRFALVAYPEFVISDRFNLSKRDLPFLFSIFIIGGTGYIVVETEYRPVDKELMVMVEAAAGGSASLGFAFGPVAGSVFISISVALRYQKRIGSGPNGGSGLTVSLVLVIAGNVSLWGIAHIYLGITLTMSYHESGQIDGIGALSVELRISRWFKLKYSTSVRYKLRNGQATRQVTSSTEVGGEKFNEIKGKVAALKKARRSL